MIIQLMIGNNNDKKVLKKFEHLYNYLVSNRDGLLPCKQRNIDLPTLPEGLMYRQLGTMEHNICDILAQRMKGRKISWYINGAGDLSKILAEKISDRLFNTVDKVCKNTISTDVLTDIVEVTLLSASDANKKAKKSSTYKVHTATIPYSEASVSLGRKIIRKLCGLKDFGEMSYK
ncbi:hypothetical protein [Clostridium saccharobutylicum]|uniref:Uncharacterized protein n=2 Tax=Clostridium saccharobutylicum TaxID=169679 RepID=U5MPK7_CLOSA|nr:hypothetical protein CLSA_c14210 [Clostridium saccharobutylicum DSM 13864]AQR89707.1 hypothetical protein CLOSC_14100 [Clostridium saccharobutylicum]AQR99609.1 hypothetical protein CSACC_14180 [Clostridium saccharobutylicum]AQS09339.1 hypothetical protein CLOBY_14660 [Clostridium saccharobutylicum]AQS13595.1 hypothetical protein CLOSACC_14180 [Clostridium saccharobutylicum]